jgi:predicted membrane protein (TIGR00267 family)
MARATLLEQHLHHSRRDPHVRGRWLSDLVLGAQDGLVNTLGVVLGVAAASADSRIVFATGIAAGLAEALSMAAVGYSSTAARGDLFRSERDREYRHLTVAPDIEREEIREIYAAKGFEGELLERVVETICTNKDVWVSVMMAEEHGLAAIDRRSSLRAAAIIGLAALIASFVPAIPFAFTGVRSGIVIAVVLGAALLFALGAYKARVTAGRWGRSGLELTVIGMASGLAGYVIAALLAR